MTECGGGMKQLGDMKRMGRLVVEMCVCRLCGALAWLSPRMLTELCSRERKAAA